MHGVIDASTTTPPKPTTLMWKDRCIASCKDPAGGHKLRVDHNTTKACMYLKRITTEAFNAVSAMASVVSAHNR
jgi:hypothetical protein